MGRSYIGRVQPLPGYYYRQGIDVAFQPPPRMQGQKKRAPNGIANNIRGVSTHACMQIRVEDIYGISIIIITIHSIYLLFDSRRYRQGMELNCPRPYITRDFQKIFLYYYIRSVITYRKCIILVANHVDPSLASHNNLGIYMHCHYYCTVRSSLLLVTVGTSLPRRR